jgi:hypothetical protein
MVLLAATCGNSGSYTLNNSFIEGTDQQINGTVTGVTGRKSATGANETPSATYSSTINRQMIIGLVVKAASGGTTTTTASTTTTTAASTTTTAASTTTTTSGGGTEVWLEAECGNVGSLWNINSDSSASGGQYVTIQSGNNSTSSAPSSSSGHITYSFDVQSGTYDLWARVITPNGNDDSFWVQMDGGSWYQWNNIGPTSSWSWEECQSYSLSSGSHTLTIAYREDGAELDKLYIGNSTPSGTGGTATNCGGSTTTTTTAATTTTTTAGTTTTTAGTTTTTSGGQSITIQENAAGFCDVDGTIDNNHSGYTGSGFANTDNANGNGIDYSANVTSSGTFTFTIRYANGSSDRSARLLVNGSTAVSSISFPGTGDWDSWSTVSVNASMTTGVQDIRLEATNSAGLANIDSMEISGPGIQTASCN